MPKIIDLAINTIPSERQAPGGPFAGGYWMSVVPKPDKQPRPKPPQPPKPKPQKNAGELPDEAVMVMKQQLQQRIKRHVYS
jgi:hypothetical protein